MVCGGNTMKGSIRMENASSLIPSGSGSFLAIEKQGQYNILSEALRQHQ